MCVFILEEYPTLTCQYESQTASIKKIVDKFDTVLDRQKTRQMKERKRKHVPAKITENPAMLSMFVSTAFPASFENENVS